MCLRFRHVFDIDQAWQKGKRIMKELFRSNNLVTLSFVEASLRDAGVEPVQLDTYASSMEGSVSAIERRIMVLEEDYAAAQKVLADIGDML